MFNYPAPLVEQGPSLLLHIIFVIRISQKVLISDGLNILQYMEQNNTYEQG